MLEEIVESFPKEEDKPVEIDARLTEEDENLLNSEVSKHTSTESQGRIRSVLNDAGLKKLVSDHASQLRALRDAMIIADRWDPRNESKDKVTNPQTGDVVRLPAGNVSSVEDMSEDATRISALNTKVAFLRGLSKAAVKRAEARLDEVKSAAKRVLLESKKSGKFTGKVSSVSQAESIADTLFSVKDAAKDLNDVSEQADVLDSCYFALQQLSGSLMDKARLLSAEYSRTFKNTRS